MEVTVRIDGNKNYDYAKTTLTLIDNVIYVVEHDISRLSLHLLNDGYITYAYTQYSDNLPKLLELIKEHYYDIVVGIKFIQKVKHGLIENVSGIQGLTISDW